MESFVIFEASGPITAEKTPSAGDAPAPKGQEGNPSLRYPHIIFGGKSCADQLRVGRILKDGSTDIPARVVYTMAEAAAAASSGKFVVHLASTCDG